MKILFVSRYYFPHIGGIEQNIEKVSSALSEDNLVEVLTVGSHSLLARERFSRVNILRVSIPYFLFFNYSKYDAIFIENVNLFPHLLVVLKLLISRKPKGIFFVPHGGLTPYWKSFSTIARTIKKIANYFLFIPFINMYATSVVAVSKWEINELKRIGICKKVILIPNGYEQNVDYNRTKSNFLVFVGRIDPIKNIEQAIVLLSEIASLRDGKDLKLKIIGDTETNKQYVAKLKLLAESLGLTDKILFLGKIVGDEKLKIISEAKALLCLSHFETDPIVIKEAFSQRTKVIITPNYGLSDYIGYPNTFVIKDGETKPEDVINFLQTSFLQEDNASSVTWGHVARMYKDLIKNEI
jgi:glycosyltransferase involved in cell wall biosynthesis